MCLGPGASFTTSVILLGIGAITLRAPRKAREFFFAAMPLVFGILQFIEGSLWLSLLHQGPALIRNALASGFLFIALCFWPTYMPLSLYNLETRPQRKKIMAVCLLVGICLSIYFLAKIISAPNDALIVNSSIQYQTAALDGRNIALLISLYIIATCLPWIVCSRRGIASIGGGILLLAIPTAILYHDNFVSVWCFTAAVLSLAVCFSFYAGSIKYRVT